MEDNKISAFLQDRFQNAGALKTSRVIAAETGLRLNSVPCIKFRLSCAIKLIQEWQCSKMCKWLIAHSVDLGMTPKVWFGRGRSDETPMLSRNKSSSQRAKEQDKNLGAICKKVNVATVSKILQREVSAAMLFETCNEYSLNLIKCFATFFMNREQMVH